MNKRLFARIPNWLFITAVFLVILTIGFKVFVYFHHLSFIPDGMGVWRVIYSKEEAWGFGPGVNETGVIVYKLPTSTEYLIEKDGIDYLSQFPSVRNGGSWRGIYKTWYSTPISQQHKDWFQIPASDRLTANPLLDNYINKYGFGIDIKITIDDAINKVISTPGSYFAYARSGGVIIVAPSLHWVFYIYAG